MGKHAACFFWGSSRLYGIKGLLLKNSVGIEGRGAAASACKSKPPVGVCGALMMRMRASASLVESAESANSEQEMMGPMNTVALAELRSAGAAANACSASIATGMERTLGME